MADRDPSEQARKREYYLENREKIRERQRGYYLENREKVVERQAAYRGRPGKREAQKRRAAEWYKVNGEKARCAVMVHFYGLRPEDWAAIWQSQEGRCRH